ncbi:MAG: dephospho-CoA kinase [Lachnospiraceae bacterium]|nr:dephospho-CoA kinase [Lachnospiraceae bacterium]
MSEGSNENRIRTAIIGVTGGAGAGKSECLRYIQSRYNCQVLYADPEAAKLRRRGEVCYEPLVQLLGTGILGSDGEIDAGRMAAVIYADPSLREQVNRILHPAVNARIFSLIDAARQEGKLDFFFIEAALLIENGYEHKVDEMWYIYAEESVRRKRLSESRGYSDERIDGILAGQLTDDAFRAHAQVVIDNSGSFDETRRQIDRVLGEKIGGTKRTAD